VEALETSSSESELNIFVGERVGETRERSVIVRGYEDDCLTEPMKIAGRYATQRYALGRCAL